ncbi:MAG TPA: hypothetical protein VGS08_04760 [Candidatus Saccharimonadales bacterium]|nr:hypothetical protein [Candidatus Saccharimonadales bacterium]
MTATICPTITAQSDDTNAYNEQVERLASFALRIHIDLTDGQLAPTKNISPEEVWWPGGVRADLHVMYRRPFEHTAVLLDLGPQLIIVHAEAEGDFKKFAEQAHDHGIEVGVALQQHTSPELIRSSLHLIDHVLVFSGDLGHFGGHADFRLITKVKHLRELKPTLEIGWDGGVNDDNARALAMSGVDVLNVGGFIQKAKDPNASYEKLVHILAT